MNHPPSSQIYQNCLTGGITPIKDTFQTYGGITSIKDTFIKQGGITPIKDTVKNDPTECAQFNAMLMLLVDSTTILPIF